MGGVNLVFFSLLPVSDGLLFLGGDVVLGRADDLRLPTTCSAGDVEVNAEHAAGKD